MSIEKLKASELIVNDDGSIYHLAVKDENVADNVIIVGDQGRVKKISDYFDHVEFRIQNREFITHTGTYKGCRISVMSTGIGTDNIDIFMNELDAAVNIDLTTKLVKDKQRHLNIFRLGTTGGLHHNIPVGSIVISKYGLGLDGLIYFYDYKASEEEESLLHEIKAQISWPSTLPTLYLVKASDYLFENMKEDMVAGITATAPGFYAPQGRNILLQSAYGDNVNKLMNFRYDSLRVTNFEMETSAFYGLGKLRGHNCCTMCVVLANRATGEVTDDHHGVIDTLIRTVLDRIVKLN